jgi:thiol-disulfide isomerase/thioredoxin
MMTNSEIKQKFTPVILSIMLYLASPPLGISQPATLQHKKPTIEKQTDQDYQADPDVANYGKYEFTFKTLENRTLRLKQFGGKITLVNIWAPWCDPCKKETDGLVRLYNNFHKKGFEIIGIAVQTTPPDVRKFINSHNVRWPVGIKDDITKLYKSVGIPASYLFDSKGNLIKEFIGYCDEKALEEILNDIFKNPQPKKR